MAPKLFFIYGTRPEAIKMAKVVEELRALGIEPKLISTGQHTSLLKGTPAETVLAASKSLGMPSTGSIFSWTQHAELVLCGEHLQAGDHVVVQGDTMSAFAGASAAAATQCVLHHIEAGVRSNASEPWPEEDIRKAISGIADYHYCATKWNAMNLIADHSVVRGEPTYLVTGNPVVTSLLNLGITPCAATEPLTILITLHRRELRESSDFPEILDSLFWSIGQFPEVQFLWPVHPSMPAVALRAGKPDNLELTTPFSYVDFVVRLSTTLGLFTDSGGAVEEAATLGVPTIIFRRHNDRPEAVEAGIAQQWVPDTKSTLISPIRTLVKSKLKRKPHNIYGDRKSAFRIAEHIWRVLS